jgi:hypothetical protein
MEHFVRAGKESPSILNELVETYLPALMWRRQGELHLSPFLPSKRSRMDTLHDLIRKWAANDYGSHSQALQLSGPSVDFEGNFYRGYN